VKVGGGCTAAESSAMSGFGILSDENCCSAVTSFVCVL
jgi:hypothetical protein